MAYFKPKRFDVAGAHPDEAWRAVANIREAVEDVRRQFIGGPEIGAVNRMIGLWDQIENRPMRYGNTPDVEVQRFLAQGVQIVDALTAKTVLGLSQKQQQVRDRCDQLARSMERVLAKRPDEALRPQYRHRQRM